MQEVLLHSSLLWVFLCKFPKHLELSLTRRNLLQYLRGKLLRSRVCTWRLQKDPHRKHFWRLDMPCLEIKCTLISLWNHLYRQITTRERRITVIKPYHNDENLHRICQYNDLFRHIVVLPCSSPYCRCSRIHHICIRYFLPNHHHQSMQRHQSCRPWTLIVESTNKTTSRCGQRKPYFFCQYFRRQ